MKKVRVIEYDADVCCSKGIATKRFWDYKRRCFFYHKKARTRVVRKHNVRNHMSLHMHCILEKCLERLTHWIHYRFDSKYSFFLWYDLIYGWIASHSMKEIIRFWLAR